MQSKIFNMKVIFALVITLVFAYAAWEAFSYAYLAKIFPLSVSLTFLLLALANLGLQIRACQKEQPEGDSAGRENPEVEISATGEKNNEEEQTRSMPTKKVCLYIGLLYLGIWLIGYPLSIFMFITIFYRRIVKTDWILAVVAGLIGFDFVILVSEILALDWPTGLIQLPWPLG